eukprot:4928763-Karenia_brevis.AAC.1
MKQNANDENQLVTPALLKPDVGLMISLQDEAQTPPYIPTTLRPKMEIQNPVDVTNLRNLSMTTVSWPYRRCFGDAVPLQAWSKSFYDSLVSNYVLVGPDELVKYIPCDSDIMDVRLVTLPRISGLEKKNRSILRGEKPVEFCAS